jgi:hypothetical protein
MENARGHESGAGNSKTDFFAKEVLLFDFSSKKRQTNTHIEAHTHAKAFFATFPF